MSESTVKPCGNSLEPFQCIAVIDRNSCMFVVWLQSETSFLGTLCHLYGVGRVSGEHRRVAFLNHRLEGRNCALLQFAAEAYIGSQRFSSFKFSLAGKTGAFVVQITQLFATMTAPNFAAAVSGWGKLQKSMVLTLHGC